jgi:hypothetical protein
LLFGLLLFVVGTLLVGNAWSVVDTKLAADAASREAVQTFVEAGDPASATAGAIEAARQALTGYGRDPQRSEVAVAGPWVRCGQVTVTVTYLAPLVSLPLIGDPGTGETVRASATEIVDPYRTGLPGTSTCA